MEAPARLYGITPEGTALWPSVSKADTQHDPNGKFHIRVKIEAAKALDLVAQIDKMMVEATEAAQTKAPSKSIRVSPAPYSVADQGEAYLFTLSQRQSGTGRDGLPWKRSISLWDSLGKPLKKSVGIEHGAVVKCQFAFDVWQSNLLGVGVSLKLMAVQLVAPPRNDAAFHGFSDASTPEEGRIVCPFASK